MKVSDAIVEFGFDCKVRKLSEKTVSNYELLDFFADITDCFILVQMPAGFSFGRCFKSCCFLLCQFKFNKRIPICSTIKEFLGLHLLFLLYYFFTFKNPS